MISILKKLVYIFVLSLAGVSCSHQQSLSTAHFLDSDLDGVHDRRDACPTISGSVFNLGCPEDSTMQLSAYYDRLKSTDADLDGVPDDKDECPNVYGSPFNQGCPFVMDVN